MTDTPDFAALVNLFPVLRNFVDGCGEVTLTSDEAAQIRLLGFQADEGRWKVPPIPPGLVRDNPLLERLSIGWETAVSEPHGVDTCELEPECEIQPGPVMESSIPAEEPACSSALGSMPSLFEKEQHHLGDPRTRKVAPRYFRLRQGRIKEISKRDFLRKLKQLEAPSRGHGLPKFTDSAWERLQYKGKKLRKWLEENRSFQCSPWANDLAWKFFKKSKTDGSDLLPWLIWLIAPQYPGIFERRRPRGPKGNDPFGDMPEPFQSKARNVFARLCKKWAGNLPSWRKAILIGRARRLATHPFDSHWGRSMRAKRGGYAVQEKYRREGRHPLGLKLSSITPKP